MKRALNFVFSLLLVFLLGSCGSPPSSSRGDYEPMTEQEIQRYRDELYLRMSPAQRNYYESLASRPLRDRYLRDLGLLKDRDRKR